MLLLFFKEPEGADFDIEDPFDVPDGILSFSLFVDEGISFTSFWPWDDLDNKHSGHVYLECSFGLFFLALKSAHI
jgi:hypothetical protein